MEELNDALATLINTALEGVDTGVMFLQAELPDVIVQLLMWHAVKSGLYFVGGILIWVLWLLLMRYCKAECEKDENGELKGDEAEFLMGFGAFTFVVAGLISMFWFNLTWLQIWIAPKVWLLEYAAQLIN